jgi:transcriptional regulator with XRE-family HTH domain
MRLALETVASNVRRLREALDLTQEQAAGRAGVGLRSWQRLEAGETNATLDLLVEVADALGADPAELFARSGHR